ncbi:MAG: formyltransferase family protein [Nitrospirota bacterium]
MSKIKIALFGGRILGYRSLEILNEYRNNVDVKLVIPNKDDGEEGSDWKPPLIPLAKKYGFDTLNPRSLKEKEVIDCLKEKKVNLILNSFCTRIMPKQIIDIPEFGAINFHYGKLPEYGGRFIVTHIILNGETDTCATAHYMEEGIDTGDIIFEEPVSVKPDDTAKALYFRCTDAAIVLFRKVLDHLISGTPLPRRKQEGEKRYFHFEEPNKCQVDLDWGKDKIERFVRAVTFEPVSKPCIKIGNLTFDIIPRK